MQNKNQNRSYLDRSGNYDGNEMLLSQEENYAVQAKLNLMLGAKEYDSLFLGFECGELIEDIVHVYARSEYQATRIEKCYTPHVAIAVESILRRPVKRVNVLPRDFSS
jgi:hypothetical protein